MSINIQSMAYQDENIIKRNVCNIISVINVIQCES
jgi:hypothetical protein